MPFFENVISTECSREFFLVIIIVKPFYKVLVTAFSNRQTNISEQFLSSTAQ